MEKDDKKKLWKLVYDEIKKDIATMKSGENKLPSENEYVMRFQVSRSTVREALQALTAEHFVTSRHGKGSFAHPSATKLPYRVDLNLEFISLLSTPTAQAQCKCIEAGVVKNTLYAEMENTCDVYRQVWAFSLHGENRILYLSETPLCYIDKSALSSFCADSFILVDFLKKVCHLEIAYQAVFMTADQNTQMAAYFDVPKDAPLLVWEENVYDLSDVCITKAKMYFHPKQPLCQCIRM